MARRGTSFFELRGAVTLIFVALIAAIALGFAGRIWHPLDLFSHARVHLGIALIAVAVVLLAMRAPARAAAALLFGTATIAALVQPLFIGAARPEGGEPDLKLVSFNMLFTNTRSNEVAAFLEAERPDFAFVLEAPSLFPYLGRLTRTFPYRSGCTEALYCDLLVLSRHPFEAVVRPGPQQPLDRFVAATATIDGKRVHAVAVHFSKPFVDGAQWHQMRWIGDVLKRLDGPVLLAGDFNLAPWSRTAQDFRRTNGLTLVAGYRPTWPARLGPLGVPIDHVMVRGAAPVEATVMRDALGSNHRGLIATFRLDDQL